MGTIPICLGHRHPLRWDPESFRETEYSWGDRGQRACDRFGPAAYQSRIERLRADVREQSESTVSVFAP